MLQKSKNAGNSGNTWKSKNTVKSGNTGKSKTFRNPGNLETLINLRTLQIWEHCDIWEHMEFWEYIWDIASSRLLVSFITYILVLEIANLTFISISLHWIKNKFTFLIICLIFFFFTHINPRNIKIHFWHFEV